MQEAQNIKVVQDAYAAFGRADLQGIPDRLDDGIVWKGVHGAGPHVPTSGERHGKAQVGGFFTQLAQNVNFSRFEPKEFIGKTFDADFAMVFTLANGKAIEFQEFTDSAAINAAFAAEAAV